MKPRAFRACVAYFDTMLNRSDLTPEQRQVLERCRDKIRKLGRNRDPADDEVYRCIEEVAKMLVNQALP